MRARANRWFYGAAVLMLAVAMLGLVRLLRQFEADLQTSLEGIQRVFADEDVLRTPSDPAISFRSVEDLVAKYQDHGYFGRITVSKIFAQQERVVYPFYLPALLRSNAASSDAWNAQQPTPPNVGKDVRSFALSPRGELLGRLYVRVNTGPLQVVRLAIGSLSALMVGATLLFILQFRRQEQVISRTTIELEEKRRELVRLERLAMAGQLSANLLHDLKKPILNIKNEIEELDDRPRGSDPPRKSIAEQIGLFFGILRDSPIERFVRAGDEQEFVDVNEMLDRSIALVRYERGNVEVVKQYDAALPPVLAPPVRLVQVFSNLILNAYQAMGGTGQLRLTTSATELAVRADITDTGPGIGEEHLPHIFAPFFTTKPEQVGTGLGLYITQEIVRELGGTVEVETSPGGTTFKVTLPRETVPNIAGD
jgi:signal transduction histidine kinase